MTWKFDTLRFTRKRWIIVSIAAGFLVSAAILVVWITTSEKYTCKHGTGDQAIKACTSLIGSKKLTGADLAEAFHNRAIAYLAMSQNERAGLAEVWSDHLSHAANDDSQAIKLKPDYAEAYYNRGVAIDGFGLHDGAIRDFDKAIKLKPDYADAFFNRGLAYYAMDDLFPAIADFDRAIALKPGFAEAFLDRGNAYGRMGQYKRAIQDFDQAISLKPDDPAAFYNRSMAKNRIGDVSGSTADIIKAQELDQARNAIRF